jgi:hypothetical protein
MGRIVASIERRIEQLRLLRIATAVMAGVLAGFLIGTAPEWRELLVSGHWWEQVSAVATLGAVFIAVWAASRDSRLRREAQRSARLVFGDVFRADALKAWAITQEIAKPLKRIVDVEPGTDLRNMPGPGRDSLQKSLAELDIPVITAYLGQAVHFPPPAALAVAQVASGIVFLRHHAPTALEAFEGLVREGHRSAAAKMLTEIDRINTATFEMRA